MVKRKFLFILAMTAALLMGTAASADGFLETADVKTAEYTASGNAEGIEKADELKSYVLHSGAAEDVKSEQKRINMRNYMLNLKKQRLDFAQGLYSYAYDNSGRDERLGSFPEKSYAFAEEANQLQKEISLNEEYLSRLTDSGEAVSYARRLESELPNEKKSGGRILADIAAIAVLAGAAVLFKLTADRLKKKYNI